MLIIIENTIEVIFRVLIHNNIYKKTSLKLQLLVKLGVR